MNINELIAKLTEIKNKIGGDATVLSINEDHTAYGPITVFDYDAELANELEMDEEILETFGRWVVFIEGNHA